MSWMWTVLPSSSVRPTHEPRLGPSEILLKYSRLIRLDCPGRTQPAENRGRLGSQMFAMSASHRRAAELGQRIEHGLQGERRPADDLEHVGSSGLLLKRFTQLVEQARILDGDDGLRGEVR